MPRDTPRARASSRVDGSRSPARNRPALIASRRPRSNWDRSGSGSSRRSGTRRSGLKPVHSTATKLDLIPYQPDRHGRSMSTAIQTLNPASVTLARPRLLTGSVVRLFGADFAAMCSFYLLLSAVPLYAADRGIGAAGAGISTGVLMFASVAAEIAAPAVSALIGHRRLLLVGLVLLGVPAMAMPVVSSLALLLAVCAVRGAGFAVVVVAVGALAATVLPADRRGEGLGMLGVVAMMPAVVTLPAGVWLVKVAGYPAVFIAAAAAALVAVVPV